MSLYRGKRFLWGLGVALLTFGFVWRTSFSNSYEFYWKRTHVDELNGLLYMVSYTDNTLPANLDLSKPIKHTVWASADSSSKVLWEERIATLNSTYPLIVFSKTYCVYSRGAKELLAGYKLDPAPKVIEVDTRSDSNVIKALLIRLTKRGTFPNVILRGTTLGGYDDVKAMHESGALKQEFEKAGLRMAGGI